MYDMDYFIDRVNFIPAERKKKVQYVLGPALQVESVVYRTKPTRGFPCHVIVGGPRLILRLTNGLTGLATALALSNCSLCYTRDCIMYARSILVLIKPLDSSHVFVPS